MVAADERAPAERYIRLRFPIDSSNQILINF
jgi:hypothetical protein